MKKDIHPKYETATVECACGNSFETRSTHAGTIKVELCSNCHPFFTGKQKFVDTAGRVDKFRARMEAAAAKKAAVQTKKPKREEKVAEAPVEEKAAEVVVEELEAPTTPIEITQPQDSDEELAAADEIADGEGEHKAEEQNDEQ